MVVVGFNAGGVVVKPGLASSTIPGTSLVTGAGRGTGRDVARALAAAGSRVVCIDVNPDAAQRTAAEIEAHGQSALARQADISNKMAVQTLLYDLLEAGQRLAVLVNAAHISPATPALTLDEWEWNRTLDVNLKGAFLMSQTVARAMKETGGGLIVNIVRSHELAHAAASAARAGLVGLSGALALELAPIGVRVALIEASGEAAAAEVLHRCAGLWSKA
jgi:NAD(P)-dependent dehydrogenase (short-subunit alcohol dehydrogenase family)